MIVDRQTNIEERKPFASWLDNRHAPRWAPTVVVLSLTVEWGVGIERQGPSYGEVVSTKDVRVQALPGGSNSPTSRSPEAVEWIMNVWITRCRTLCLWRGVAYIECARTPASPRRRRFKVS